MTTFELIVQPDAEEPGAAEIFVAGVVAGRPYHFLLDTGAARTTLPYDAHTATYPTAGNHRGSGVFSAFHEDLITVPRVVLGPIVRTDMTVIRTSGQTSGHPLIGMDLLKEHCLLFRFGERRVWVDPARFTVESSLNQELWLDKAAHPYVSVWFGALEAQAVWDTGAGITVVDLDFVREYPELFQEAGSSTGTDATGMSMSTPMFLMTAMVIGNIAFPPQRVAGVELSGVNARLERPMNLILGYNTLSRADWMFDFPQRRWGASPVAGE
ncbi:retropepsin-like aspartic protease [Deinococcus hopiensis]|uniref:Aspartyl protease n=1 Tax=Deinococcus hopiensis KR-140 TaxID=695939 RepID=A0A1W1VWA7_9DEIO|nr:retropepsin-like aspartic protease [Deinococcus hopiensis]SMB97655.1 Aspartyl protease [Deinococcus hopiensis KR-140]